MSSSFWFVAWIFSTIGYYRQRRRRRKAEEKTEAFGVVFAAIVKRNPETVQKYFTDLIEADMDDADDD